MHALSYLKSWSKDGVLLHNDLTVNLHAWVVQDKCFDAIKTAMKHWCTDVTFVKN